MIACLGRICVITFCIVHNKEMLNILFKKMPIMSVWVSLSPPLMTDLVFNIFALSAGFQLSKINIGNTGNQNHPDLKSIGTY